MTWLKLYYFNRRVDMLWRKNQGYTFAAIAEHWQCSRQCVVAAIRSARQDPKVIEGARVKAEYERKRVEEGRDYVPVEMRMRQEADGEPDGTKMP